MLFTFRNIFRRALTTFHQKTFYKKPTCRDVVLYLNSPVPYVTLTKYGRRPYFKKLLYTLLPSIVLTSRGDGSYFSDSDVEDNIAHLMILAKVALEKGDVERAEAILHMGVKICDEHQIKFGLPQIYDILTTIAIAEGDIDKAENLLVTVIEKMIRSGVPENNNYILDFKLRLARIYSSSSENDLAEIGFKTCLEAQRNKILNGDVSTKTGLLYVNILFWYGIHMIRNERYANAKNLIDTAYDYSNRIKGLSPYQEMVILYTLSDLNMELGEYDMALQKMQSALMLGKGISSSDLPKCYVKLSKIYMKLGVFDQAKNSAEEGAKLARIFNKLDIVEEADNIIKEIKILGK